MDPNWILELRTTLLCGAVKLVKSRVVAFDAGRRRYCGTEPTVLRYSLVGDPDAPGIIWSCEVLSNATQTFIVLEHADQLLQFRAMFSEGFQEPLVARVSTAAAKGDDCCEQGCSAERPHSEGHCDHQAKHRRQASTVTRVPELLEQVFQLVATAVNVADDVEWSSLVLPVVP